jgi:LPS-assembly protein
MGRSVPAYRLLCLVVVAWLALLPSLARGQERERISVEAGAPVTVYADHIQNLDQEKLLIAEGNVQVEQGEVRLEADRIEVNTETGEAVATGHVVMFDGRDRLTGERIEYNLRSGTGIVYQAEAAAEPHFFFGGERMERFGDKAYRIAGGTFTTCEDESPAWSVHLNSATAYMDDYMWGTGASFWAWRAPLIPFIPFFATSLRKDRHSGLLTPTFGSSSDKGFFFRQPIYFVLSDSQDLTVAPAYFSKRGVGLGATYRYVREEGSKGEIDGFYLHDTEKSTEHGEDRGIVSLRHDEAFTPRLNLKADLGYVSDDQFLSEFGNTLDQRSAQRLESNLSLTQRWDKWNFVGRLFAYQDLTTDQPIELQRLPDLRLSAFSQPIPWVPRLLFEMDSSYVDFVRDIGSGGQRLDVAPRISYPISPGGFFTLTPRIGIHETFYDTEVIGTSVDHGIVVEDTKTTPVARSLFEAGLDLDARAYRVFDLDGAFGIQKLQHVIEPRVSYNFLGGDDPDNLPQWDGIDVIKSSNLVTYSLINRLKAREVSQDERPGRVWELIRFTLSQTYTINPTATSTTVFGAPVVITPSTTPTITPTNSTTTITTITPKRLSDVGADLIVEPLFGIRFRGTATFDPYDAKVTTATTDLSYEASQWRAAFGTRHGTDGRLVFIQGSLQAQIGTRWTVRFSSDYNTDTGTVIENRLEIDFKEQCWGFTAAFIDRQTDDEFRISINLLELGQYGFGRGFSGL